MNLASLKSWATQPTTIHAFGALALGVVTALAHVFGANPDLSLALGGMAYVMVHAGINDDTASRSVERLVVDSASAYQTGNVAAVIPVVIADAPAVIAAIMAPVA